MPSLKPVGCFSSASCRRQALEPAANATPVAAAPPKRIEPSESPPFINPPARGGPTTTPKEKKAYIKPKALPLSWGPAALAMAVFMAGKTKPKPAPKTTMPAIRPTV